ncbi:carboxylesterase family protein [Pseudonocardia sp. KRD291]|uniref:carboxylesterase family protein n=1 Tax=Pseudonocardia sp. KRD291 TaxID=2792007 RepID=UPI001C4A10BD|nr:carboxylesterase family protein [Pseudonocardia sp. KRD291]MBW0101605.1 carboxylesterase/lipase family protein [Pseudonocardia sp. KRD291]
MGEHSGAGAPRWDVPAGTVLGRRDDGVLRATGIRYATAGRFERPVPEPPAAEPIDATSWSPACPQEPVELLDRLLIDPQGGLTADEHCQHVSVTLPEGAGPGDALPVMVWIHGGSYTAGAGDAPVFDVAPLVREQDVVVVSVTYRLGLFGYLGGGDRPANLGLWDQIEALRWVRRNIAGFGGDPDDVTLFGHSAGGDAIAHLMIADGTRGLFRRAIVQSAPLGISRGRAGMSRAMAEAARELDPHSSAEDIVAAQPGVVRRAGVSGLKAAMPFGTQYGHPPLPAEDEVDDAWAAAAPDVDVLIGHTSRETALFVSVVPGLAAVLGVPVLGRRLGEQVVRATTRRVYADAAAGFALRHRRGGGRGYRYTVSWGAPGSPYVGAHMVELPLLFGTRSSWDGAALIAGAQWSDVAARGRELRAIWAGFARTGEAEPVAVPGFLDLHRIP